MQWFQRGFAFALIVAAVGFFAGCGGPGAPTKGSSEPAEEAANAALAPEGVPAAGTETKADDAAAGANEANPAPEATPESPDAASAPESGN